MAEITYAKSKAGKRFGVLQEPFQNWFSEVARRRHGMVF